jgi:hypothetical protein
MERIFKEQKDAGITEVLIAWTTWQSSSMNENEQIEYIWEAVKIWQKYW